MVSRSQALRVLADFGGGVLVVVEIADEGGDGALEVDVVFPEGVVGVDEEGLAGGEVGHGFDGTKRQLLAASFSLACFDGGSGRSGRDGGETMLMSMDAPRGKQTETFLPLQAMSPGRRPSGRPSGRRRGAQRR